MSNERHNKDWTHDENQFLIDNSCSHSIKQLSKMLGRKEKAIKKRIYNFHLDYIGKREVRHVDENFFKTWNEDMAYVLGYWFADGCIGVWGGGYRFTITSNDLEHLKKIQNIMGSNHKLKPRRDDKSHTLTIGCKEIYNDIIKLGGCERKSLVAEFPDVPEEYLRHFIRGNFDGDGSIYFRTNSDEPRISFVGSESFIKTLNNKLPYHSKIEKVHENTHNIRFICEYAQDILKLMYEDCNIYLERKYKLYKKTNKWKRQRKLRCDSILWQLNGLPQSYTYGIQV